MEFSQNHTQSTGFGSVRLFKQIGPCQLVFSLNSINITETGLLLTSYLSDLSSHQNSFNDLCELFRPSQIYTMQIEPPDHFEREPFFVEASVDNVEEKNHLIHMSLSFLRIPSVLNEFLDDLYPDRHKTPQQKDQADTKINLPKPLAKKRFHGF